MGAEPRNRFRSVQSVVALSERSFSQGERLALLHRSAVPGQRSVEVVDHERNLLDFSRCSYTGLGTDPRLMAGARNCLELFGSLHWPVARTRLEPVPLRELEERLGAVFRARVITYSSVSLASASVLPVLASGVTLGGERPLVLFDARAHASLQVLKPILADETEVLTVAHQDWEEIERHCRTRRALYVCDGVWSMGGGVDMGRLRALQERWGLAVYIDDAHGVSIRGVTGEGYARSLLQDPPADRTFLVTSLSKGFGASGAAVMIFGEREEQILRRFSLACAFSHPLSAPALGAALSSSDIHLSSEIQDIQLRLQQRIRAFDRRIQSPWSGDGLPIRRVNTETVDQALEIASTLLEDGMFVSPVFFPTVSRHEPGIRVCLSAAHELADIERLTDALHVCGIPATASSDDAPPIVSNVEAEVLTLLRRVGTWDIFDWPSCYEAGAQLVCSDRLKSVKRERVREAAENAATVATTRMLAAAASRVPKRGPISASKRENGQYVIVDGNATLQALWAARWFGEVPVVLERASS